mgnify:FL=1
MIECLFIQNWFRHCINNLLIIIDYWILFPKILEFVCPFLRVLPNLIVGCWLVFPYYFAWFSRISDVLDWLLNIQDGMAELWKRRSVLKSWAISRTRRWKGSLRMRSSVDFWYLLISRRATVPGLYLWGFLTPPVAGADLRAALVASCFLGALPPVDFLAVCLVRAIALVQMILMKEPVLPLAL